MNNHHNQLLDVLTQEGVLINVSIRYWRGRKKLAPEDLGLSQDQVSERLIALGHKRILPREALAGFALIESRAHALVENNTFSFLGGLARFVPNAKLGEIREKLEVLETEFLTEKQAFLDRYEERRATAIQEWRQFAPKVNADPHRLAAAVEEAFPSPIKLEQSFAFETRLFQIALPESMQEEASSFAEQEAVAQARERAAREATDKLRHDTEEFVADCVATLREQTAKLCTDMLASIGDVKCGVHQKTLNRLNRFIDRFKELNFANDTELEAQLEAARNSLLSRTAEEYRDNTYARRQLVGGLQQLRDRAGELARADAKEVVERFGELGRRKILVA